MRRRRGENSVAAVVWAVDWALASKMDRSLEASPGWVERPAAWADAQC